MKLVQARGGEGVYVPKPEKICRAARDRAIRAEFTGSNFCELARKYGLTVVWTRAIVGFERYTEGGTYDYVISLGSEATSQQCSIMNMSVDTLYAKNSERISYSIPDFSSLCGKEERKVGAGDIRDTLKSEVIAFLTQIGIEPDI